jgi:acetyl/propionyl-CoA carboxylase alpha subunit
MEELIEKARHIEVQCAGDGTGRVVTLGERECSLQRKQQKIIEITPSPSLSPRMREQLQGNILYSHAFLLNLTLTSTTSAAAISLMAADPPLSSLCTVEFLVRGNDFWFIEANPRLQVEHTVTEAVFDLDLVALQVGHVTHARRSA